MSIFDDSGKVKEAKGDPISLDKSVDAGCRCAEAHQRTRRADRGPEEEGSRRDGRSDRRQPRNLPRQANARWAISISDAVLDRIKDQGVTIVFQNGGGLRASIDQGVVTMGEVLTVLPFQNTVATFKLAGEDIVAALSTASADRGGRGRASRRSAGLKYSFDKSVAPNDGRVKDGQVMEAAPGSRSTRPRYTPSPPTIMCAAAATATSCSPKTPRTPTTSVRAWSRSSPIILAAHRPYTPKLEGRITEIAAAAPAAPAGRQSPPNLRRGTQPAPARAGHAASAGRLATTSPPRRRRTVRIAAGRSG